MTTLERIASIVICQLVMILVGPWTYIATYQRQREPRGEHGEEPLRGEHVRLDT